MNLIEVGKIINTHGLRGEVKAAAWTDTPDVFEDLERVYAKKEIPLTIRRVKYQKNNLILQFAELSTIEEAYSAFVKKMHDTVHGYKEASSASCDFSANEETALNNITIAVANKMYLERYFAQFKKA